jgi:CspA family cold shock protein
MRGRVKLWVAAKQYGFVAPDDGGKDVFFHESVFLGGPAAVREGSQVDYELKAGTKVPQASAVRPLQASAAPS